jgi:hypothetical protein
MLAAVAICIGGCFEIPTNYSKVIYPQVFFAGAPLDTSFIPSTENISVLNPGDTFNFYMDSMQTPVYDLARFREQVIIDLDEIPSVYFKVSTGDTFYLHAFSIPDSDDMIIVKSDTSDVLQISSDTLRFAPDSIDIVYGFQALRPSKGNIAFELVMKLTHGNLYSTEKGVLASYCIDAPDTLSVHLDSVSWNYWLDIDRYDTTWMQNRLVLEGTTNAFVVSIYSYAIDRNIWSQDFIVGRDGHFSISYEQLWLVWSMKMVLHGAVGPDQMVPLKIPKR